MSCTLLTFSIFYTLIGWSFNSCIVYSLIIVVYRRKVDLLQKLQNNRKVNLILYTCTSLRMYLALNFENPFPVKSTENNTPFPVISLATKTGDLEKWVIFCSHWDWFHFLLLYSLTPVTKKAKIYQSSVLKSTLHKGQWVQKEQDEKSGPLYCH